MNVAELDYDERLRLAEDPAAAAELLGRLYEDAGSRALHAYTRAIRAYGIDREGINWAEKMQVREDMVRRTVAAHPNAPRHILAEAVIHFPESFCRNPAAPLLALEDPSVVSTFATKDLRGVLRCPDVPRSLLHALHTLHRDSDPWLAEEIAMHVGFAGEAPDDEWQAEVMEWMRRAAAGLDVRRQDELRLLIAHRFAPEGLLPPGGPQDGNAANVEQVILRARLGASVGTTPLFRLLVTADPDLTGADDLFGMLVVNCKPSWVPRLGVALNPHPCRMPIQSLQFSPLEDGNRLVRAAARARLRQPESRLLW